MIQKVIITNQNGVEVELPLGNPYQSGFAIIEIDGITPPDTDVHMTESSVGDGSVYANSRVKSRSISFTLQYVSNPAEGISIEDVRHKAYSLFPLKKSVTMRFVTDRRDLTAVGYVSKHEIDIFSEAEQTKVTLECPDAYLYNTIEKDSPFNFSSLTGGFEFPFTNPVHTKTLHFAIIDILNARSLLYKGDSEIGVIITINATDRVVNPEIHNLTTKESIKIDTTKLEKTIGTTFGSGTKLIIDTRFGHKSITFMKTDGSTVNAINAMGKDLQWMHLIPGENSLVSKASDDTLFNMNCTIEYRTALVGI